MSHRVSDNCLFSTCRLIEPEQLFESKCKFNFNKQFIYKLAALTAGERQLQAGPADHGRQQRC